MVLFYSFNKLCFYNIYICLCINMLIKVFIHFFILVSISLFFFNTRLILTALNYFSQTDILN